MRILPSIRPGLVAGALIAAAALVASSASLAVTMIQTGQSDGKGDKKPGWAELDSFRIIPDITIPKGDSAPREGESGPGSLSITKVMDKAGTKLHEQCCEGEKGKKVTIDFATSNKDTDGRWIYFTLEKVVLNSYELQPLPDGGDVERLTYDYGKLKWQWSDTPPKESAKDEAEKWAPPPGEVPRGDDVAREAASDAMRTGLSIVPRITQPPVVQGPMTAPVVPVEPPPPGPPPGPPPLPPGPM